MESLLLVSDPFGDSYSVQFEFTLSVLKILKKTFNVSIFSPHFPKDKLSELESLGIKVIRGKGRFWINGILNVIGKKNESMMWLESWFREAYFSKNTKEVQGLGSFDKVINLSLTVPIKSDILLLQGRSVYYPLNDIKSSNSFAALAVRFLGKSIKKHDLDLLQFFRTLSKKVIVNSKYLSSFYENLGYEIEGVVLTSKNFDKFKPQVGRKRDYVLTYIGKETDILPIFLIAERGLKVKGFGSKVPVGISLAKIRSAIEYLGYVSTEDLVNLYSGALFTAFPFTEEPFGYVPIESMSCGTPVLAYNKQGPSETIINGKTGWLVSSKEEFVNVATEIWKNGHGLSSEDCVARASEFKPENVVQALLNILQN